MSMKFFKNSANTVFAFEADGSQDAFIPQDLVPISEAEADALRIVVPSHDQLVAAVIADRDARLVACDWTQLRDIPDATASLWQPYRQALRNVTQQPGFPTSVTWPLQPQ